MGISRILVPFAVGVTVGVVVHKYRREILDLGGPRFERAVGRGTGVLGRVRTKLWEQGEKFSDLVAEIRAEEEAARTATPPQPAPLG